VLLLYSFSLSTVTRAASTPVTGDAEAHNWLSYGRSSNEQRFSPLTQINQHSIRELGLAWSMDLPLSARTLEATPLAVDGVLYFTTSLSVVYAVNASDGRQVWRYDPEPWKYNARGLRTIQGYHRGVAYWDGLIFVGSSDGRLICLDAKSGAVKWSVDTVEENDSRKQITGAPRVFNGKVIIGHAGADFGTRGYVTAYDAQTGQRVWRFYTVPGNPAKGFEDEAMKQAAATWSGEWWKWGGGGTVWNAITFDAQLNRIYIGTGNSANYNPQLRSPGAGDNLYLASIVALDADTGGYLWHYQVNPREAWDFKATADMVLADLTIGGKPHKVLMQAPTNGFFYVLDRKSGRLLSAEKLGKVTWADHIDLTTGRPVESPNIRYENGPVTFWPSPWGIHNWQPMAFDPRHKLMFIPTMKLASTYQATEQDVRDADSLVIGSRRYWIPIGASIMVPLLDSDDGTGQLVAWDPVAQHARWKVALPSMWNGGVLATASDLVFQGTGSGWLFAYDSNTGRQLWKFYANNGIVAPPVTYMVGDTQYITVLAGYGGATSGGPRPFDPGWRYGKHPPRVLTFKLHGTASLAPTPGPDYSVHPIVDSALQLDSAAAARGARLWAHTCSLCHGAAGAGAGPIAPDLRESPAAHDFAALRSILHDGTLASGGMPQFDERTDDEIRDLRMYIEEFSRAALATNSHPEATQSTTGQESRSDR